MWEKLSDAFFGSVIAYVITCCVAIVTVPIYKAIASDGKVDHCYIVRNTYSGQATYTLKGFVPWRSDIEMSSTKTLEEAKQQADLIGCTIH